MKITIDEIFKLGLWDRYCEENGINPWAVNEGLMDKNLEVEWELKDKKHNSGE